MVSKELLEKAKKCSTKEELLELAKQENAEVSDDEINAFLATFGTNRELSDDELSEVSGGAYDYRDIFNHHFYGHVGQYSAVPGTYYYVTDDGENQWWYGQMLKSEEEDFIFGTTRRMHTVYCETKNGSPYGRTEKFYGKWFTLYLYMENR